MSQFSKWWDSASGQKSRRHSAQTAERMARESEAKTKKALEGVDTEIAAQKERDRTIDTTLTPEKITRTDVQDVIGGGQATINTTPQQEFRTQQQSLAGALAARARGETPSAAEMQFKAASDRALAQQMAMQAGASGAQGAAARRQAVQQQGTLGQQLAAQGAQLRAQEQAAAEQSLAGVLQGARTSDIGLATAQGQLDESSLERSLRSNLANQGADLDVLKTNAAAGNQMAIAELQAQLQKLGMDDAMAQTYINTALQKAGIESGAGQFTTQTILQQRQAQRDADAKMLGAAIQGGATAAAAAMSTPAAPAASDVNLKKDIKPSEDKVFSFLDALKAYDYKYKDPKFGEGDQTSVMAQDLEKSEIGQKAVLDTPEGKMVDYQQLLPAMLASEAKNHERITELEKALHSRKVAGIDPEKGAKVSDAFLNKRFLRLPDLKDILGESKKDPEVEARKKLEQERLKRFQEHEVKTKK